MKRRKPWVILLCLIVLILLASMAAASVTMQRNNRILEQFSGQLLSHRLPEKTTVLSKKASCGNLIGKGDSLDYSAILVLQTDLSKEDLSDYFSKIKFHTAYPKDEIATLKKAEKDIEDKYRASVVITEGKNTHLTNSKSKSSSAGGKIQKNTFTVILLDRGYPAGFDIRGY